MEFAKVGAGSFAALGVGAVLAVILPVGLAALWCRKKKEPVWVVLIGAATFLLFALVLEKPLQSLLIFPTQLGMKEHAASQFINARPLLLAFLTALFPGVFEETGRLVAYKTVLRRRRNRETGLSHGIGHGGFEALYILGATYAAYIVYAVMINAGSFGAVVDKVAAQAPEQLEAVYATAEQIAAVTFASVGLGFMERIFAVGFHIGASVLVFYACRDRERFWLYPLAVALHTAMDFVAALYVFKLAAISTFLLEVIVAVFGIAVFCCAYFLLYRRDANRTGAELT